VAELFALTPVWSFSVTLDSSTAADSQNASMARQSTQSAPRRHCASNYVHVAGDGTAAVINSSLAHVQAVMQWLARQCSSRSQASAEAGSAAGDSSGRRGPTLELPMTEKQWVMTHK
jgi:hypothetical protein